MFARLCSFCGANHEERPACGWHLLSKKIDRLAINQALDTAAILERLRQMTMENQAALDTELTATETAEAAEEAILTQESADLKTLLAAIPPSTAVNLAPEIARLQALVATMGTRTTSATADDKSITAETAVLEPPAAPPASGTPTA